jgi:hypothetical protein
MVKGPWFLEKMNIFTNIQIYIFDLQKIHYEKTCYEMKNGLKNEPLKLLDT